MKTSENALHGHRFLLRAGLAIGNVFTWVFVFEYFLLFSGSIPRSVAGVALIYALSQLITFALTPIAASHLRRGTRPSLIWAAVCAGSAFIILGATLGGYFSEYPVAWGVAAFAVLLGAYRALYFAPFEINQKALEGGPQDRLLYEFLLALIPAFVGATLVYEAYAPLKLLFGAGALAILSALPLYLLPNIHERFSFSYVETFKELFSPKNSRLLGLSFLEGIQGAALFLVWPLMIFIIVGWSYAILGVIFSLTLLIVIMCRSLFRKFISTSTIVRSLPVHVTLAITGWVLRSVAGTPVAVIVADAYEHTLRPTRGTVTDPFAFEQVADGGSYIDEYTALKEMGLALGRIALAIGLYVLLFFISPGIVFTIVLVVAAIAAGCTVILSRLKKAVAI